MPKSRPPQPEGGGISFGTLLSLPLYAPTPGVQPFLTGPSNCQLHLSLEALSAQQDNWV